VLVQELAGESLTERNYAKQPLTKTEVKTILKAVGSVAEVLNTRHATAKANGWKEKAPNKTVFAAAVLEEPNLIRRPITLHRGKAVVGRDEEAIRALLKGG
jgi:arsenate reductase